ncbi:MAG: hypothetical protein EXS08_11895 [Planctomycetes bacterium]|nr:hypothetical protein [Planctomycetota bacterium]
MSATGRYEHSDAHARPLLFFGFGLALLLAGSMAVSAWFSQSLSDELAGEEQPSPIEGLRKAPEGPELQSIPARELELHHAWEQRMLTQAAWIDPLNQIVRIPIEDAMKLSLAEGYPVRAEEQKR